MILMTSFLSSLGPVFDAGISEFVEFQDERWVVVLAH